MTRQIKAIKASPQSNSASAPPPPDTAADIYQSFTEKRQAKAFSELLKAAPPETLNVLHRPGVELSPEVWHGLADNASAMGQSRKGTEKTVWEGLERRLRNTATFVERGGARPDVLSVIPGATLPERKPVDPFGFASEWTGRAEKRGLKPPEGARKASYKETVTMAADAAAEMTLNTVKDVLNIFALSNTADKFIAGKPEQKGVMPEALKTRTTAEEAEAAARESQDIGQNLTAGAIQAAPYLISKALFPLQAGMHPESAGPMIKDMGTKIVDILKMAAVGSGEANLRDPAVRAEVEKSAERLRREPVENLMALGMAIGLPMAGGRFVKGLREGGRLVEGEPVRLGEEKVGEGERVQAGKGPGGAKLKKGSADPLPTKPVVAHEKPIGETQPKQPWEMTKEEFENHDFHGGLLGHKGNVHGYTTPNAPLASNYALGKRIGNVRFDEAGNPLYDDMAIYGFNPGKSQRGKSMIPNDYPSIGMVDASPDMVIPIKGEWFNRDERVIENLHRNIVEQAAQEGKFGEGIKDYPDLMKQYQQPKLEVKPPGPEVIAGEKRKAEGARPEVTAVRQPWELTREEYLQAKADEAVAEGLKYAEDLEAGRTTEGVGGMWTAETRAKQVRERYADTSPENVLDVESFEKGHRQAVEKAIAEGKAVPEEVLAEFKAEKGDITTDLAEKEGVGQEAVAEPKAAAAGEEPPVVEPKRRTFGRTKTPTGTAGRRGFGRRKEEVRAAEPRKPWEMNAIELEQAAEAGKSELVRMEKEILGDDWAEWNKAQKQQGSRDRNISAQADETIAIIEKKHSQSDIDKLYGVGEKGIQPDELRDFSRAVNDLDDSSPETLGRSIARAMTDVGEKTDPADMTTDQQIAYTQIRHALRITAEKGFDPEVVFRSGLEASARRFSDPNDAAMMLSRYLPKENKRAIEAGKAAPARRRTFQRTPTTQDTPEVTWITQEYGGGEKTAGRRRAFSRTKRQPEPPEGTKPPDETAVAAGEAKPGEILGLSKAESERLRKEYSLDERDPGQRKAFERSFTEARERHHDANALSIAEEVIGTRRPITDAEFAGMNLKARELHDGYNAELAEASRLREAGNPSAAAAAVARADAMMVQFEKILEAADIGGAETARALAVRRMGIKEDYTVASLVHQAEARSGRKVTAEERAEFERLSKQYAETEAKLADLEAKYQKALGDQERLQAENELIRENKKAKITFRAAQGREKIALERAELKKQLLGLGYRLNDVTGVTAEASYLIGKLAVTYIKEGVLTLDEIVRKVMVDIPGITERDVWKSLNARNPKLQERAKSETEREIARLKTRARLLVDLEKAEKGVFEPSRPRPKQAEDIRAMQDQLKKMRQDAYKSVATGAKLERAIQKINELKDMLEGHYRSIQKRDKPMEAAEVAEAKARVAELRKMMAVEDDIAALEEQIRSGQYVVREKPAPKPLPPELERLQIQRRRLQTQVDDRIKKMEPMTVGKGFHELVNIPREAMAAGDISATLRQGQYLALRQPLEAAKAFGRATAAMFSKYTAEQIDNAIRNDPRYWLKERSKLYLPESQGAAKPEEFYGSNWIQKLPGYGEIIKGSERHFTTYLNLLRSQHFDLFLDLYPNATRQELDAWAHYTNVVAGRGDLPKFKKAGDWFSTVFFAPRYAVSRVETPYMLYKYWKLPRVRNEIAKELVRFSIVQGATLGMARMMGAQVGTDPQDADFGKIVVGNQHVDIGAGFMQPFRLLARTAQAAAAEAGIGRLRREFDLEDLEDAGLRFMEGKFSPIFSVGKELITSKYDPFRQRRVFRNYVGEEETLSEMALRNLAFMTLRDVYDIWKDAGAAKGLEYLPFIGLGVGVTTYDASERERANAKKDLKVELREAAAAGDTLAVTEAYKAGKLSKDEYRDLKSGKTDVERTFATMSIEKAMEAYERATDEVKDKLRRPMLRKIRNWVGTASRNDKERLLPTVKAFKDSITK